MQRGGARKLRRELRRDEYIVSHSRNAIRRGEAARDILNYIPSDQRDYNNPAIAKLYNLAVSGTQAAFNNIYRGTSVGAYSNTAERAKARVFGNMKGVNVPSLKLEGKSFSSPSVDFSKFEGSLNEGSRAVEEFAKKISNINVGSLGPIKNQIEVVVKEIQEEGKKYKPKPPGGGDGPNGGNMPPGSRFGGILPNVGGGLAALTTALISGAGNQIGSEIVKKYGPNILKFLKFGSGASGAGTTGLLGTGLGAIGGLGAGTVATAGALILGTAAVGGAAGYGLEKGFGLGTKTLNAVGYNSKTNKEENANNDLNERIQGLKGSKESNRLKYFEIQQEELNRRISENVSGAGESGSAERKLQIRVQGIIDKLSQSLTSATETSKQSTATLTANKAPQEAIAPQKVQISAAPATVTVQLTDQNGQVIEQVLAKIQFLEDKVNELTGTPKPAKV